MTIIRVARWVLVLLIVAVMILMGLSRLGVNVGPLLASAGVAGLAVSLGAKSLIEDFISGITILAENIFVEGDSIQVGTYSGDVEKLTLRATRIRTTDGSLVTIPNGQVRTVANQTRAWSRAVVDLGLAYEQDLDRSLEVLQQAAEAFAADPEMAPRLLAPPEVLGVQSLGDWAIQVRVMVKTKPGAQWAIGRALRRHLLAALEREGIELPYARQPLAVRGPGTV